MVTTSPRTTPSVELFVRSLSPTEKPASDHAKQVRHLESEGHVDTASVTVWGHEVDLSTPAPDTGQFILDRVATFRSWADDNGVTMKPFFEIREVQSTITCEEYAALRLPVCCLAEFENDELVHVAPYSTGEAICSVADRIRRLGEGHRTHQLRNSIQTESISQ